LLEEEEEEEWDWDWGDWEETSETKERNNLANLDPDILMMIPSAQD